MACISLAILKIGSGHNGLLKHIDSRIEKSSCGRQNMRGMEPYFVKCKAKKEMRVQALL